MKARTLRLTLVLVTALAMLTALAPVASAQATQDWVRTYDGPGNDYDRTADLVTDSSGNVYVVGHDTGTDTGPDPYADRDAVIIKYDSNGNQLWIKRYDGPTSKGDAFQSVALDSAGNILVTGETGHVASGLYPNADILTMKYAPDGTQLWLATYNGQANYYDAGSRIAVDSADNIIVTGMDCSTITRYDFCTIKYNSSGVQQWVAHYVGLGLYNWEQTHDLAVDAAGNVYITGRSSITTTGDNGYDWATVKYNASGIQQWAVRYDGPVTGEDRPWAIAVDGAGNVYVTGDSDGGATLLDCVTIKYNSSGVQQWLDRYDGPASGDDAGDDVLLSGAGVFVSGYGTGVGTAKDVTLIRYDTNGVQQWVATHDGPASGDDLARDLDVDGSGYLYVTGRNGGVGTGSDYVTMKYDTSGVQQWLARYDGPVSGTDGDTANAIHVDGSRNVYVTGNINGPPTSAWDWGTIKYSQAGAGGGCFIATAALGPDDSSVETLRAFRDDYLATNPAGRGFVSAYYKLSPPVAGFIDDHSALKPAVRAALVPSVGISTAADSTGLAQKIAIVGSLALASIALAVWVRRRQDRASDYS